MNKGLRNAAETRARASITVATAVRIHKGKEGMVSWTNGEIFPLSSAPSECN